jgi:hypothetical protein
LKQLILGLAPDGTDRFRDNKWRGVFERQARDPEALFATPLAEERTPFTAWRSGELLWERVQTLSQVAVLGPVERDAFRARFDEILSRGDQVWKGGEVEFHGFTTYGWTRRL